MTTDHRAEAERALARSLGFIDATHSDFSRYAIGAALVGIGHALLANLGSNRPYDYEVTMDDPAWDRCHWWTDGDGWAFTGQTHWPGRRRCALYASHDSDHSDPERPAEEETPDA